MFKVHYGKFLFTCLIFLLISNFSVFASENTPPSDTSTIGITDSTLAEYYGCDYSMYPIFFNCVDNGTRQHAFSGDIFDFTFDFYNINGQGTNTTLALGNDLTITQGANDFSDVCFRLAISDGNIGPASLDISIVIGDSINVIELGTYEMDLQSPSATAFWNFQYHFTSEEIAQFKNSGSATAYIYGNETEYINLFTIKEVSLAENTDSIVDVTPPEVVITSPIDGFITNQTPASVIWTVDGVEQTTELTEDLVEGTNTITRTSTDAAGNIGTASIAVTLDTQAPAVVISSPADGSITNESPATVIWTVDGVEQTTELTEDLVEGINTITRSATDAAGNVGSDEVEIIYNQCIEIDNETLTIDVYSEYSCIIIKSGGILVANSDLRIENLIVENGGVAYINDTLFSDHIEVLNGGLITHNNISTNTVVAQYKMTIIANDLIIELGGIIDVSGKGYPRGQSINSTTNNSTFISGSHAVMGKGAILPSYGNLLEPGYPGSGGGSLSRGGSGGGVIHLILGNLNLQGSISANGNELGYGSGAGGSIWVVADSIIGHGNISASGGGGSCQGSGGRIALYGDSISQDIVYNTIADGYACGTVYIKSGSLKKLIYNRKTEAFSNFEEELIDSTIIIELKDSAFVNIDEELIVKEINAENYANLTINAKITAERISFPDGGYIEISDSVFIDSCIFNGNTIITHPASSAYTINKLILESQYIYLGINSRINADGKGFPSGVSINGQISTNASYRGGSHAGVGQTMYYAPFAPYGDSILPVLPGSGGGENNRGGFGGGVIILNVDKFDCIGNITAKGMESGYGDGAGGSILIYSDSLICDGYINADGGMSSYHGSGGRIAIYSCLPDSIIENNVSATGNNFGTVYTQCSNDDYLVNIISPDELSYSNNNIVPITWTVNGVIQDSLVVEELIQEGENIVVRSINGNGGNVYPDTINIIYDTTKPVIEIISPVDSFYSPVSPANVVWTSDGVNKSNEFELNEGENIIYIEETDFAGNYSVDSLTIFLDTKFPKIVFIDPLPYSVIPDSIIEIHWMIDSIEQEPFPGILSNDGINWFYRSSTDKAGNRTDESMILYKGFLVPDCITLNEFIADSILQTLPMDITIQYVDTSSLPKGEVVGQSVLAGDTAMSNDTITLFVSKGISPVDLKAISLNASNLITDPNTLRLSGTVEGQIINNGENDISSIIISALFEDVNRNEIFDQEIDNIYATDTINSQLNIGDTINTFFDLADDTALFLDNKLWMVIDINNSIDEINENNNTINSMYDCNCTPDSTEEFHLKLKWVFPNGNISYPEHKGTFTPFVANINDDNNDGKIDEKDIPDAIFMTSGTYVTDQVVRVVNGKDGTVQFSIRGDIDPYVDEVATFEGWDHLAIADINKDGKPEIILPGAYFEEGYGWREKKYLAVYDNTGNKLWQSHFNVVDDAGPDVRITVADVDGDGYGEIFYGNYCWDHNGNIRYQIPTYQTGVVVADANLDGKQEVIPVGGALVYDAQTGIQLNTSIQNNTVGGSYTSVIKNINETSPFITRIGGEVLQRISVDGVLTHSYTATDTLPIGSGIKAPTICDFDKDGSAEVFTTFTQGYGLFSTVDMKPVWLHVVDNATHEIHVPVAAFDFNSDGKEEVVFYYRDTLRIINPTTGEYLLQHSFRDTSVSVYGQSDYGIPVVTDIDNDGSADILVSISHPYDSRQGILVFSEAEGKFPKARAIWNQFHYNIENINDDNSLPKNPPLTMTTNVQKTVGLGQCSDVSISGLRINRVNCPLELNIVARIGNAGVRTLPAGIPIGFYEGDPNNGGTLLGYINSPNRIEPGAYDDVTFTTSDFNRGSVLIYATVDIDSNGTSSIYESNEDNNSTFAQMFVCNENPEFEAIPIDSVISVGETFSCQVSATDLDGDTVSYSINNAPTGLNIDSESGYISWTPSVGTQNRTVIKVAATDPYDGSDTLELHLYYDVDDNLAPTFTHTPALTCEAFNVYSSNASASDPDGDALHYFMVSGPLGFSINETTGEVRGIATPDQIGNVYNIELLVTDYKNGWDTLTYNLTVIDNQTNNNPPVFGSDAPVNAIQGERYSYLPTIVDIDGDVITYWVGNGPLGMLAVQDSGIIFIPSWNQIGDFDVIIFATDGKDTVSQEFVLNVANINDAPVITSTALDSVVMGLGYSYQVNANDPDNDQLTYELSTFPSGMTITNDGYIQWPYIEGRNVTEDIVITVSDPEGLNAIQSYTLREVADNEGPNVNIILSNNPAIPGIEVVTTVNATDNVSVESITFYIDSIETSLDSLNQYRINTIDIDSILLTAVALDVNGNSSTISKELIITNDADLSAPVVNLSFSPEHPQVGDIVTYIIDAQDDNGIDAEMVWLNINGKYVSVDNGIATYEVLMQGEYNAKATAYDLYGNYGEANALFISLLTDNDMTAPTVAITSPEMDTEVSGQISIAGTATDESFAYYTLSYLKDGGSEYIEFHNSRTAVVDGELGVFDATNLENGLYKVRLQAFDIWQNSLASEIDVWVTGQKKVGQFTLAFNDMNIALPGVNLEIMRSYDSRDKLRGDFGYGWNMAINSVKLYQNSEQGQNWDIELLYPDNPLHPDYGYVINSLANHKIRIEIPGGRTQEFKVAPKFFTDLDPHNGYMTYEAIPGTYSKLEQLDKGAFYVMGGELYDPDNILETFNPILYKLTMIDGSYYIYNKNVGSIVSYTDVNGNSISYSENKISHSTGDELNISRDSENRITTISDPDGRTVNYTYDGHGNLQRVTDPEGNVTRFKYAPDHYLLEIIDPRGIKAIRTEYDDDGRMVRQINALGDTLAYNHDLANNTESTTDFLGNETVYTYDDNGNVLTKRDAAGNLWEYQYDSQDNLVLTTNPDGTTSGATFNQYGLQLSSTNERGYTTNSTYDGSGNLTTQTDALSRTTTYNYDNNKNLLSIEGPDGTITDSKTYDSYGNVLTESDALGNTTSYEYDSRGRMVATIDPLGRRTGYVLDNRGNTLAEINPVGDTTKFIYDLNDNQVVTINVNGDTLRSEYNVFNKVESQTDLLGNVTSFQYDIFGQLKRTYAPDSTFTERQYDANGNVTANIDEVGRRTEFVYDHEKRVTRTTLNNGTFTEVEYDALGRRTASIDRNGNRTEYEYDNGGNNTLVRDALGNETTYEYDEVNRRTAMVDALGQRTEYTYDDYDRHTRTTFHDGTFKTTAYDLAGRKISETDQAGNTTSFEYDSVGNLIEVVDAMSFTTLYTYDNNNNRVSQTDANMHTTTMEYDNQNRLTKRIYPNGDEERFYFNDNGNMIAKVNGSDSTSYQYNERNREVFRTYHNSGHTVATMYTEDGKRDTVVDYRGVTDYDYNNTGQLSRVINTDGSWIEYQYDNNSNKVATATPWDTTEFTYDSLNRMKTVINSSDTTEYYYNPTGNRDSVRNSIGTSVDYEYDNLNRLTKVINYGVGGGVLSSYEYTLNPAGIRTSVTENDTVNITYSYDNDYRLTGESRTGDTAYSITYTYDNVGNRITKDNGGVVTNYVYNNRDQLTTETTGAETVSYTYDNSGRMETKTDGAEVTTYSWIDNDRMNSVMTAADTVNYIYDADGNKVKTGDKNYLVDNQQSYAQVISEYDNSFNAVVNYTYGLERIAQDRGGSKKTYLADGTGSIRGLVDGSGAITDTYDYFAFGEILNSSGTTENEFRYVGEAFDANSGYYYLRARWMNPESGRFVSVDPYSGDPMAPVSLHRYLYGNQSPISFFDPSGNMTLMQLSLNVTIVGILSSVSYTATSMYMGALLSDDPFQRWWGTWRMVTVGAPSLWKAGSSGGGMVINLKTENKRTKKIVSAEFWIGLVGLSWSPVPFNPISNSGGTLEVFTPGFYRSNPKFLQGLFSIGSISVCALPKSSSLLGYNRNWSGFVMGVGFGGVSTFAGDIVHGWDVGADLMTGVSYLRSSYSY